MGEYYLAIDIGASSGRHILGTMVDGKMELEEIYRFENGMVKKDGHLLWDVKHLSDEIVNGLKKCKEIGKIPKTLGIDTWGVDYVLLDENGDILGNTYGYRDSRTDGMDDEVYKIIPLDKLYARNGIQKAMYNTIYQLMALKTQEPEILAKADTLLQMPDFFNYTLTGVKQSEYTMATTGQLVNIADSQWDMELIKMLGFPEKIFKPLNTPGTLVGPLKSEIAEAVGFTCDVIQVASHDTASAVIAVPTQSDDSLYISSGTWSLLGTEIKEPICTSKSMELNYTNEGGIDYRYRFLTNIMGLWMIQSVRHETGDAYSFAVICEEAEKEKDFPSRVDVNDDRFMAPENMTEEIKKACADSGQKVPETLGQIATVVYQSLADYYAKSIEGLEQLTGRKYDAINIVGGGSNAAYLNELTAKAANRTVYAGPGEATAIGNITVQMMKNKEFGGLKEARQCIFDSFGVKEYRP